MFMATCTQLRDHRVEYFVVSLLWLRHRHHAVRVALAKARWNQTLKLRQGYIDKHVRKCQWFLCPAVNDYNKPLIPPCQNVAKCPEVDVSMKVEQANSIWGEELSQTVKPSQSSSVWFQNSFTALQGRRYDLFHVIYTRSILYFSFLIGPRPDALIVLVIVYTGTINFTFVLSLFAVPFPIKLCLMISSYVHVTNKPFISDDCCRPFSIPWTYRQITWFCVRSFCCWLLLMVLNGDCSLQLQDCIQATLSKWFATIPSNLETVRHDYIYYWYSALLLLSN